ncbi:MAG: 5-formyltetrahydrofolate cyclo-ligase [Pseudomonadota bacterium]|nr:5-formyltetrahydrofolate cyclo-ligase [Pseudomonadota bacterium]
MTESESSIARETAAFADAVDVRKAALRKRLLLLRNSLPPDQRASAESALRDHLAAWQQRRALTTLAVFMPLRGEPDLMPLYRALARGGLQLLLPVVRAPDEPLAFAAWTPEQSMQRDVCGIPVPADPPCFITPEAIWVPCVGFNAARYRLGYGGGFYDRTLSGLSDVSTLGVAFDCGATDIEVAAHDIALQAIMTESGLR